MADGFANFIPSYSPQIEPMNCLCLNPHRLIMIATVLAFCARHPEGLPVGEFSGTPRLPSHVGLCLGSELPTGPGVTPDGGGSSESTSLPRALH
jgi:hypothetical protein